jgi:hypothetical protein
MYEAVARRFGRLPGWVLIPEASFSIFGERGIVDILMWHAAVGALAIVELKTAIVDVQELIGTMDRKRRRASRQSEVGSRDPCRRWYSWRTVEQTGAASSSIVQCCARPFCPTAVAWPAGFATLAVPSRSWQSGQTSIRGTLGRDLAAHSGFESGRPARDKLRLVRGAR